MTSPTRLILVEGTIGAGKTTATTRLAAELRSALAGEPVGVETVAEGAPDHPADLERVAAVDEATFAALAAAHPGHETTLRSAASPSTIPGIRLVHYGILERDHPGMPAPLRHALAARDAYELPLAAHLDHRMAQWHEFVRRVAAGTDVWILDCCAIQNPLTVTLVRDDAPLDTSIGFVSRLLDAAARLSPIVVHLRAGDAGAAFRRAIPDRPAWWLEHVTGYYTGRALGRRLGARGVEGTIEVLRHRAEVEGRVLEALRSNGVRVIPVDTAGDDPVPETPLAGIAASVAATWIRGRRAGAGRG